MINHLRGKKKSWSELLALASASGRTPIDVSRVILPLLLACLMGGASPDAALSCHIRCPLKALQGMLASVSLKSSSWSAGFCGTHSTQDPMWVWSTGSSPAQQGFPLAERFLCSTFSSRNTCLQVLLFTLQPFSQTPGLSGTGGSRNPGGSGSCCLPLSPPAPIAELRHTMLCL